MIVFAYYLSVFIYQKKVSLTESQMLIVHQKTYRQWFIFFGHSVNNIITDGFTNKKNMSNKKQLPISFCR
jgi:hypothetical protein